MSSLSVRTGNAGTANVDTITLPDGSSAVGHVALGADGNPIVLAADASVEALASAVVAGLATVQGRAALKPVGTAGIALSGQIAPDVRSQRQRDPRRSDATRLRLRRHLARGGGSRHAGASRACRANRRPRVGLGRRGSPSSRRLAAS